MCPHIFTYTYIHAQDIRTFICGHVQVNFLKRHIIFRYEMVATRALLS
jgi:hypothetical protein